MFKQIRQYIRINRAIHNLTHGEGNILDAFSKMLGVRCRVDKLNRIYCVINPIVDNVDSDLYTNRIVYEYDAHGRIVYTSFINAYIMRRIEVASMYIESNAMFDMLTMPRITRIDDDENYLVVFQNIMLDTMVTYVKRALIAFACVACVATIACVAFSLLT